MTEAPEGVKYLNSHPTKVCVDWARVVDGTRESTTEECFTSEVSAQSDLIVDTGLGADGPTTEYELLLFAYYDTNRLNPVGGYVYTSVTLNAGTSATSGTDG